MLFVIVASKPTTHTMLMASPHLRAKEENFFPLLRPAVFGSDSMRWRKHSLVTTTYIDLHRPMIMMMQSPNEDRRKKTV